MEQPLAAESWAEMALAVLSSVAALLDERSLQEIRLVCKAWRQPVSLAVQTIRPKITGSLGLQWHDLPLLSKAFSACAVLDLRLYQVPTYSGQYLLNTAFTEVLLSNVKADPEPRKSLDELYEYIIYAASYKASLTFEVDVHHLPSVWSPPPFTDQECLRLTQYPKAARIVKLHLGTMPAHVTQIGLSYIAQLTSLTELSIICSEDIDDAHMLMLSALTNLITLRVGFLSRCCNEALTNGLSNLNRLQKLSLIDAVNIDDDVVARISSSLSATLQALSVAKCPQLTDECMLHLCMPHLSSLFFSNSAFITPKGVQGLLSQSPSLVDIDFRGCACLSVKDRMKWQQVLRDRLYIKSKVM